MPMGQIDVGAILHQQHHGPGSRLFVRLVQVRLHQSRKSHIGLDLRKPYNALVWLQGCI
jgi:hypothetical protein